MKGVHFYLIRFSLTFYRDFNVHLKHIFFFFKTSFSNLGRPRSLFCQFWHLKNLILKITKNWFSIGLFRLQQWSIILLYHLPWSALHNLPWWKCSCSSLPLSVFWKQYKWLYRKCSSILMFTPKAPNSLLTSCNLVLYRNLSCGLVFFFVFFFATAKNEIQVFDLVTSIKLTK